ncbi:MAG: potassium-transporting ATPase subunit KdpA [Rickettsiales bacterium]
MMDYFTEQGLIQIALYFATLFLVSWPLGYYIGGVYSGNAGWLERLLSPLEHLIYRLCGIKFPEESNWQRYARDVVIFSTGSFILLYLLLLFQNQLPFNPGHFPGLDPDLAFNTAVSFITNTNWQSYGGETTMSYFSQMAGLTVQNFMSAAVGMAVMAALARGIARRETSVIGNFWVDLVRGTLYILLPLAIIMTVALVYEGVVQTLEPSVTAASAGGQQTIAVGPAASQIAIKQLGTNGGGFFNVNSSHPFENPTAISNFLELLAILLIPAACCHAFARLINDRRQGWALLAAMTLILVPLTLICFASEQRGTPSFEEMGIDQKAGEFSPGGNMEGKEVRFGIANSALWASATTAASNGSVNAMHDSFTPLGGMVPLVLMQFGEVIYGGVGSGLYGMIMFVLITVFIAGLMVGRTPEYMGKKVQSFEMKMAALAIILPAIMALFGTALAVMTDAGRAGILNPGPHGFSEVLYALTSAANNNGSAFAGLTADTPFYNTLLGIAMLVGRFWVIIPVLAIAGSFAGKKHTPESSGTLPTHTPLFVFFLVSVVVMVGVLTYVPSLAVGPIAEQLTLEK